MTTIQWSGYQWNVKVGSRLGPGPNNWSDSTENVYIDNQGNLHLKITYSGNEWYCSEITSVDFFGYGIFNFKVSPMAYLDTNVVLGMFTYADECHEIDIEYSKWGNPLNSTNAGFTIQPQNACCAKLPCSPTYINDVNTHRFNVQLNQESTNSFLWSPNTINFKNTIGNLMPPSIQWSIPPNVYIPEYSTIIPTNVHINLWLYQGNPPQSNLSQEIVISSFQFLPLTYDCIEGICQPAFNGNFTEPTCNNTCVPLPTQPPSSICSPSYVNIMGKCISENLIILGGLGTIILILASRK